MGDTKIEWTDKVDNIIVAEGGGWWCRHASPGCDNCYAEARNKNSFFGGNGLAYRGAPPALKLRQEIIDGWRGQRKPKKHFVASMTDVFGDWVPRWMIFQFLDGMAAAPQQTFQSYEPALGSVNWSGWEFVSQIIAGGESGAGARPADPQWFRDARDWCGANGKAFFFKQWGRAGRRLK